MKLVLPCFVSHYSHRSLLTLEPKGKTKSGSPPSIVDLCVENDIKDCLLVDSTLGGAYEASRNLTAAGVNLFFGYKVIVCADINDKTEKSIDTESKVIIFPKNENGWKQLVKIANRSKTEGFYYQARTSWAQLKELWTDDLTMALPFFSSFIARNTLTINHVIPDLPCVPTLFIETNSGLPFAPLIEEALERFNVDDKYPIQRVKTILYKDNKNFEKYIVYRAKLNRTSFDKPNLEHLASDKFSLESYKTLCK